jgi:hypothetical protein
MFEHVEMFEHVAGRALLMATPDRQGKWQARRSVLARIASPTLTASCTTVIRSLADGPYHSPDGDDTTAEAVRAVTWETLNDIT